MNEAGIAGAGGVEENSQCRESSHFSRAADRYTCYTAPKFSVI
jgi:hypothetical protein